MTSSLGPLVRLEGISIAQLPAGGKGIEPSDSRAGSEKYTDGSASTSKPLDLKTFITNALSEAIPFIDGVAPKSGTPSTWKTKGAPKKYTIATAPVHLYTRTIPSADLDSIPQISSSTASRHPETWACRRSIHSNSATHGTASWTEFKRCFQYQHAESEKEFTPTVIGHRRAISWDTKGLEIEINGEKWDDVTMNVEEMTHKIDPKPLKNRTFPVLQLSASLSHTQEFIVVSIPINNFEKSPYASEVKDKSLVVAAFAAVERVRVIKGGGAGGVVGQGEGDEMGEIEWIMATASDARGVLPMWVQNMAVPGAISKDVEFFMTWVSKQRNSSSDTAPVPAATISKSDGSGDNRLHGKEEGEEELEMGKGKLNVPAE